MAGVGNSSFLTGGQGVGPIRGRAPEAFLWFNPFAAQYDVICGASDGYGGWCSRLNGITSGAISVDSNGAGSGIVAPPGLGKGLGQGFDPGFTGNGPIDNPLPNAGVSAPDGTSVGPAMPVFNDRAAVAIDPQPFGIRRDTFWPRSLRAWAVMSAIFILASIQLVSPTRRWRFLRRPSRRPA
jgi:hypothetical protein